MSESEWILPILGIGGLAIGGLLVLPSFMKSKEDEGYMGPIESQGYDALDRELEARRKLAELRELRDREENVPTRIPLLLGRPADDAYVITDEDFDKLDIGKKDRKFLNKQRKLRDARLERVVYGDNGGMMPVVPSYFVNTVSPYGQGPSPEFTRLVGPQDNSNTNTSTNTINLY